MRKLLIVCLILLPTIACSQPVPNNATSSNANVIQQPSLPSEMSLKVSLLEAEIIWKALRKLPVEEVEQLMAKLRQQVAEQTAAKSEPIK